MKKSIIATMFFACTAILPAFSTSTLSPLPDKLIVSNKVIQNKTVLLHLANLERKYTYVSITSMRGDLVYFSEGIKNHNGFHRAVDLRNLHSGKYLIKIKTENKVVKQVLSIEGRNIYLSNAKVFDKAAS